MAQPIASEDEKLVTLLEEKTKKESKLCCITYWIPFSFASNVKQWFCNKTTENEREFVWFTFSLLRFFIFAPSLNVYESKFIYWSWFLRKNFFYFFFSFSFPLLTREKKEKQTVEEWKKSTFSSSIDRAQCNSSKNVARRRLQIMVFWAPF